MPISGALLNVATVLLGTTLGLLLGGRLPERFQSIVMGGLGLGVILIGIQNALVTRNPLILLGSILLGGLIGELLRLDMHLDNLGNYLQRKLTPRREGEESTSTVSEAFVTSSLVFCVGPLTILGSIQNGISGDISLWAIKSLLDGFAPPITPYSPAFLGKDLYVLTYDGQIRSTLMRWNQGWSDLRSFRRDRLGRRSRPRPRERLQQLAADLTARHGIRSTFPSPVHAQ